MKQAEATRRSHRIALMNLPVKKGNAFIDLLPESFFMIKFLILKKRRRRERKARVCCSRFLPNVSIPSLLPFFFILLQ